MYADKKEVINLLSKKLTNSSVIITFKNGSKGHSESIFLENVVELIINPGLVIIRMAEGNIYFDEVIVTEIDVVERSHYESKEVRV